MKNKNAMKEFNLEAAIKGAKLTTRDGRDVTGFKYVNQPGICIHAIVWTNGYPRVTSYVGDGHYLLHGVQSEHDLMMATDENGNYIYDNVLPPVVVTLIEPPATKPFDLAAAKNGARLITRSGKPARVVCDDCKGLFPVLALIDEWKVGEIPYERTCRYNTNGCFYPSTDSEDDLLMMADENGNYIY